MIRSTTSPRSTGQVRRLRRVCRELPVTARSWSRCSHKDTRREEERDLPYIPSGGPKSGSRLPHEQEGRHRYRHEPLQGGLSSSHRHQGYIKMESQADTGGPRTHQGRESVSAICGRVCPVLESPAPGRVDEPIASSTSRNSSRSRTSTRIPLFTEKRHEYGRKIAIVVPSRRSFLRLLFSPSTATGHRVERRGPSRQLTLGIPSSGSRRSSSTPRSISSGIWVEFRTGVEVGRDVSIQDCERRASEAFYLAIGAKPDGCSGLRVRMPRRDHRRGLPAAGNLTAGEA